MRYTNPRLYFTLHNYNLLLQHLLNINRLASSLVLCCKRLKCHVFDKLLDIIMQFISNVCLCDSVLSLLCKFHSNILNSCQGITNLQQGYFNYNHPVYVMCFVQCTVHSTVCVMSSMYVILIYTVCQKNSPTLASCSFDKHG